MASSNMDAKIWGLLQDHIDLKNIYAKLPLREFFHLRLVCKEWNRLASDRQFLEVSFREPFPKPYFIVTTEGEAGWLHGLLNYDASSSRWIWTTMPSLAKRSGNFAVQGLLFSYNSGNMSELEVFNLHTRVRWSLPPPLERTTDFPYVGMTCDVLKSPSMFQIVYGQQDIHTQIYDSKTDSWTQRQSEHFGMAPGMVVHVADCNGFVYIRCELDEIVTYDLEKDVWGTLFPPPGDCDDYLRDIGAWQGRLFNITLDLGKHAITAWELADQSEHKWTEYLQMPEDLFCWLTYKIDRSDPPVEETDFQIHTRFCGEYVLVFTWLADDSVAERFVLCNLDSKSWEKVEVPFAACCILKAMDLK